MQAVRGCPLVSTLQVEVADGSAMTINLNRLLGASKVRPTHALPSASGVLQLHSECLLKAVEQGELM